mmetsp:Transcript_17548/g.26586  ORF Transcript_17548/g.26586 Transcript_17548/m.26586 type:complete len:326 (+) Transcript_17548:229-1206(+)
MVITGENDESNFATLDSIFDTIDLDGSGRINFEEFSDCLSSIGYSKSVITSLYQRLRNPKNDEITRSEFHRVLQSRPIYNKIHEEDADLIFTLVDIDESGTIDLEELTNHLAIKGYSEEEIADLFLKMDKNQDQEICREEFRSAMLKEDGAPKGYFLDSVQQAFVPLGPIGRLSQQVETSRPFKKVYENIGNLFGIDRKRISKLGVSFALSYSIMSNLNSAVSLSVAWYMACVRTGVSPVHNWKALLSAYGMIYGVVTLLRPFRVAAAIGMSKLSAEYLEMTQTTLKCSRPVAIAVQYMMGWIMFGSCALCGISFVSWKTKIPIL